MWNLLSSSSSLDGLKKGTPWNGYFRWVLTSPPDTIEAWIQNNHAVGYISQDFTPSALFLDVDATTINEESLTPLAQYISKEKSKDIDHLTELAMSGKQDFGSMLRTRMECFRGLPIQHAYAVSKALTLTPGVIDLIHMFQTLKLPIFLISGGFSHIINPIAQKLGVTDVACNHFQVDNGCIQGVEEPILDGPGKSLALERFCSQYTIDKKGVVAVGDGANDLELLTSAALSVGYIPKPILWESLHVYNGLGDHRFLKNLLETTSQA
ncbi:MAG: HAD family hydrolase [Oligoflexales bacterium]